MPYQAGVGGGWSSALVICAAVAFEPVSGRGVGQWV